MTDFTIDQQIAAVRREVGMRERVYPRFIAKGTLTEAEAERQIATMKAVQATLERLRDEQQAKKEPGLF